MKSHLKDAVERFPMVSDIIKPISATDAEIWTELTDILLIRGGNKELCKILEEYKKWEDGEVLDMLLEYKEGLDEEGQDSNEIGSSSKNKTPFVEFQGHIIQLKFITYFKKTGKYPNYGIIVNQNEKDNAINSNIYIEYSSIEQRDREWEGMKVKLTNNTNVIFI